MVTGSINYRVEVERLNTLVWSHPIVMFRTISFTFLLLLLLTRVKTKYKYDKVSIFIW